MCVDSIGLVGRDPSCGSVAQGPRHSRVRAAVLQPGKSAVAAIAIVLTCFVLLVVVECHSLCDMIDVADAHVNIPILGHRDPSDPDLLYVPQVFRYIKLWFIATIPAAPLAVTPAVTS